jgi:hypothetical protein
MAEPIFMKLGTYSMATEPISKVYFINPSQQTVFLKRTWRDTPSSNEVKNVWSYIPNINSRFNV